MVIKQLRDFVDTTLMSMNELWSWFLRGTSGEFGTKKGSGGKTSINVQGRTLRKK